MDNTNTFGVPVEVSLHDITSDIFPLVLTCQRIRQAGDDLCALDRISKYFRCHFKNCFEQNWSCETRTVLSMSYNQHVKPFAIRHQSSVNIVCPQSHRVPFLQGIGPCSGYDVGGSGHNCSVPKMGQRQNGSWARSADHAKAEHWLTQPSLCQVQDNYIIYSIYLTWT